MTGVKTGCLLLHPSTLAASASAAFVVRQVWHVSPTQAHTCSRARMAYLQGDS